MSAGIEIILEADLLALEDDSQQEPAAPILNLSLADGFIMRGLGVDIDAVDTREAQP